MQSEVYEKLDEESHRWLQSNIGPKQVASIIAVQEQMVETRGYKANGDLPVEANHALVIRMYKTSCDGISEKTQ